MEKIKVIKNKSYLKKKNFTYLYYIYLTNKVSKLDRVLILENVVLCNKSFQIPV